MTLKTKEIIEDMKKVDKVCGLICLPTLFLSKLDVEEFSNADYSGDNFISGVNSKGFYRISTDAIENVIREIRNNPDSSIVTCYNQAFKEGEYPKKISAMFKNTMSLNQPDALITSVLNYYGVPTTLNFKAVNDIDLVFPIDGEEVHNSEFIPPERMLISIDALTDGEEFYNFDEIHIPINSYSFDSIYAETMTFLTEIFEKPPYNGLSEDEKDRIFLKIRDQLAMSYLVRRHLCEDSDFGARNLGFIFNTKKLDINLINFDYEFAFRLRGFFASDAIIEMLANAPEAYEKFINLTKKLAEDLYNSKFLMHKERMQMCDKLRCNPAQLLQLYDNLEMIINRDRDYKKTMGMTDDKVK